jgi:hypothetical protein
MGNSDSSSTPPKLRLQAPDDEDSDDQRPTVVPPYDVETFAHDSESGLRAVAPAASEESVVEDVRGLVEAGEIEEALACANTALAMAPMHVALRALQLHCTDALETEYLGRLGGSTAVLVTAVPTSELKAHTFDTVTGFLLAQLDGVMSVEDLIDICGLPRLTVLRALCELRQRAIVQSVA